MRKLRQRKVIKPVFDEKIEKTKLNAPKSGRKMKQKRL
jgi:hypothetical protein